MQMHHRYINAMCTANVYAFNSNCGNGSDLSSIATPLFGTKIIQFFDAGVPDCIPLPNEPINGRKTCNGEGELGDKCDFTCNRGYELIGYDSTVCQRTASTFEAEWSKPTPTCKKGNISGNKGIS